MLAVLGLYAGEAQACQPFHDPRFVSTPFADVKGLELVDERVELECRAKKKRVTCELVARYELVNPGTEPWEGHVAVAWSGDARLRAELAGASAPTELPETIRARVDALAVENVRSQAPVSGAAFETRLEPGATAVIDVRGSMPAGRFVPPCEAVQVERRHMIVSAPAVDHRYVTVLRGDVPARESAKIRLRVPDWWVWPRADGYVRIGYGRFGTALAPQDVAKRLWFERRPPVFPGGPIVGVGVDVREKKAQLKLRGGWEFGPTKWMFASVVVESDAKSHVEVVPTVEVTFPTWSYWLVWFPAPSIGLGAPVQVWPSVRPGVRTHFGLHWHVAGIIGFFDAYPPWRDEGRQLLGGVALQLGI